MRSIIATLLLSIACTTANATTIDFEEFSYDGYHVGESLVSQGFIFSGAPNGVIIANDNAPVPKMGRNAMAAQPAENGSAILNMSSESDELFSLNSFVAEIDKLLTITGYYGDADCCSMVIDTDSLVSNAADPGGAFTRYFLPDNWINLSRVQIDNYASFEGTYEVIILDDITVNSAFVPVPAAVWLFISGLSVLGFSRSKIGSQQ